MCYCNPSIRTPQCDKPGCLPQTPLAPVAPNGRALDPQRVKAAGELYSRVRVGIINMSDGALIALHELRLMAEGRL